MMRRYVQWVLGHQKAVIILTVIITLAAGAMLTQGVIASSMVKLFLGDSQAYKTYKLDREYLGDAESPLIAVPTATIFTPTGWQALNQATQEIENLELIQRVRSLVNTYRVESVDDSIDIKTYDQLVQEGKSPEDIRQHIMADAQLRGTLLSNDGDYTALLIELVPDDNRAVESLPPLIADIFDILQSHGFAKEDIHMAGLLAETVESTRQATYTILTIFPATVLTLVVVVFLLFGQLWPVFITSIVAILSMSWTMALAVFWDREVNIMMAMVPAVMVIVAFSDVIHLCSSYIFELRAGKSKEDAILDSGTDVGTACFYTSLTTFVGFVAMSMVPAPVFRQVGIILGVGVAVALALAMTLVPVFFSLMPVPKFKTSKGLVARAPQLVDRFTGGCLRLATQRPRLVLAIFGAIAMVSVVGISRLKVETVMAERLSRGNPIRESYEFLNNHFSGTGNVDLFIEREPGGLLESDFFGRLQRLQEKLLDIDDVRSAQSFYDVIETVHLAMGGEKGELKSPKEGLLAQYFLLLESAGSEGMEALIDEEKAIMRIAIRANRTGMVRLSEVGLEAEAMAKELLGPDTQVRAGGLTYVFGLWLDEVVGGQKRGLLLACLATTLMMVLSLRLLGAGLVSMLPNGLPLIVLGGFLGFFYREVDSDTLLIAMVAIGIAVDDTIHFLTRMRLEAARQGTIEEVLQRTMSFSGRAIVKTSVILCLGFAPFMMSEYYTTRIFGSLLPLTFIVALLADLVLLPALVELGILRMPLTGKKNEKPAKSAAISPQKG